MKQKSKSFNIVILPPKDITKKAIAISQKLRAKGGLFTLGNKINFPHITLYETEFSLKNIPKIKVCLKNLSLKIKPFNLNLSDYTQTPGGYIFVTYKKSRKLKDVQKNLINLLNPLRERSKTESSKEGFNTSTKIEQRNVGLYGYSYVKSQFNPHITFTKLKRYNPSALSIPKTDFSFKVSTIAIFSNGKYGTCKKLIKKFLII